MGKPLFATSGYRVRSVAAERAAAEARKPFDPRKLEVAKLEFWADDGDGKARKLKSHATKKGGLTARETVVQSLDKLPQEKWHVAVVEYKSGERMSSQLPGGEYADLDELDRKLTNSNAYSAPNFDIDTSTNTAGLTALKGSAPATTDNIFVFGGATLTIDAACAWNLLSVGETSTGACANAADRVGHLTINANVTFAGNSTQSNSGIKSVPASAVLNPAGNSALIIAGTASTYPILTNAGDALNASQKWIITWTWGVVPVIYYATFKYANGTVISSGCLGATNNNNYTAPINLHHIKMYRCISNGYGFSAGAAGTDLGVADLHLVKYELIDQTGMAAVACYGCRFDTVFTTGGAECWVDAITATSAWSGLFWHCFFATIPANKTFYGTRVRYSQEDTRCTEVVPADLAAADAETGGTLTITWSNAAGYKAGDRIEVYNNSGDALLGVFDATAGTGKLAGLTNGTAYTVYAKATSDNYVRSAASATATATPTAPAGGGGSSFNGGFN